MPFVLALSCGPPEGASGTLAYVDPNGDLVVTDLSSGRDRVTHLSDGGASAPMLSLDGRAVMAGTKVAGTADESFHVLDLTSAAVREIQPQQGQQLPARWGGGFFAYYTYTGDENTRYFVVPESANAARRVGNGHMFWLRTSSFGPRVAYSDCADGSPFGLSDSCPRRLVVETADGAMPPVQLSSGVRYQPLGFTPNGQFVLVYEQQPGQDYQVVRYDVDTGAKLTLGAGTANELGIGVMEGRFSSIPGGSVVSPDGQEVVVRQGAALVALRLDGGGARTIASLTPNDEVRAVFTALGDVFFESRTQPPGSDIFDARRSLWRSRGGQLQQLAASEVCDLSVLSRSGRTAARRCDDGIQVIAVGAGRNSLLRRTADWRTATAATVLGIDGTDRGVVVAIDPTPFEATVAEDYELVYLGLEGGQAELGRAKNTPGQGGFDFRP